MQLEDGHTRFDKKHKKHKRTASRPSRLSKRGTTSSNMTECADGLCRVELGARRLHRGQ